MNLRTAFVAPVLVLAFIACAKRDDERRVDANETNPASDAGASDGGVTDADAADATGIPPMVDLSQLGEPCADAGCPPGMGCARYAAANAPPEPVCCPADPCTAMHCPPGTACVVFESDPGLVNCSER